MEKRISDKNYCERRNENIRQIFLNGLKKGKGVFILLQSRIFNSICLYKKNFKNANIILKDCYVIGYFSTTIVTDDVTLLPALL